MTSGEHVWSHSPLPSIDTQSMDDSSAPGFTLSDVSSLKSISSGSEHSLDRLVLSDSDKRLRHVVYLIEEMITTEQTYIDALTDVTQGYIVKIREGEDTGFTEDIILEAFVNIENIRDFHIELLNHLNGCNKDHKLVAEVFIKNIAKFEMYIEFCSNFPRSLERLAQLHHDEPSKSFLAGCQNALGHIFPVEEYLHRAVQRVLKYPLLFRDMAKKLVDLDNHKIVEEALSKVLITAVKINAVKRVQELQSKELIGWDGDDLSVKGDLLLEDSFKLLGAKDPRFLFLFQKSLLVTKARSDGTFIYKKEIMMDNVTLKEQVSGDFLKWEIMESKGNDGFTLQAKDGDQKEAWVREVKRCIIDSTPGLTDQMKETLLFKLPSLNDHSQQIDKIWKGLKGLKKKDNVQIIHNPDTPISSEDPIKTFGWGPPDSYSDKNTQMIIRPGKRKLTKKKSNALKISYPVQNIHEEKTRSAESSPKEERRDQNPQRTESAPHCTEKKPCLEENRVSEIKSDAAVHVRQRDISPYVDTYNSRRRKSPDLIDTLDFDQIKADLLRSDKCDGRADVLSTVKPSRPAPPPPPPKSAPPPLKHNRSQSHSVIDIVRAMKAPAPRAPQNSPSPQLVPSPTPSSNVSSTESLESTSPIPRLTSPPPPGSISPSPVLTSPPPGSTSPPPGSTSPPPGSTSPPLGSTSPPLGSTSPPPVSTPGSISPPPGLVSPPATPPGHKEISAPSEDELTLEISSNISAFSSAVPHHTIPLPTDEELSPRLAFQSARLKFQSPKNLHSSPQGTELLRKETKPAQLYSTTTSPTTTSPTITSSTTASPTTTSSTTASPITPSPTTTSLLPHESTPPIKEPISERTPPTSPKQSPPLLAFQSARLKFQSAHAVFQSPENHHSSPQGTESPPKKSKPARLSSTTTSLLPHESTAPIKEPISERTPHASLKEPPKTISTLTSLPVSPTTITNLPTTEEIETLLEDTVLEETILEICDNVLERNYKAKNVLESSCHDNRAVVELKMECEKPVSAVRPVQQVKPTIKAGDSISTESSETPSYLDISNSKKLFQSQGTGVMARKSAIKKKNPHMSKNTAFMSSDSTEPTTTTDDLEFSKEKTSEETVVLNTGVSALIQYGNRKIMDSPYHPLPLLGLVYIITCLLLSLPIWITIPIGVGAAVLLYKLSPPHPKRDE